MKPGNRVRINEWHGTLHAYDTNYIVLRDAHMGFSMADPDKRVRIAWELVTDIKVI